MQHIEDNREQHTYNNAQNNAQAAHTELYTYSLDFYHEYAYIKNSNTIELYTISK